MLAMKWVLLFLFYRGETSLKKVKQFASTKLDFSRADPNPGQLGSILWASSTTGDIRGYVNNLQSRVTLEGSWRDESRQKWATNQERLLEQGITERREGDGIQPWKIEDQASGER